MPEKKIKHSQMFHNTTSNGWRAGANLKLISKRQIHTANLAINLIDHHNSSRNWPYYYRFTANELQSTSNLPSSTKAYIIHSSKFQKGF
jgi:hypothetical protein